MYIEAIRDIDAGDYQLNAFTNRIKFVIKLSLKFCVPTVSVYAECRLSTLRQ